MWMSLSANLPFLFQQLSCWLIRLSGKSSGKSLGQRDCVRREFNFERSSEGTGGILPGGDRRPTGKCHSAWIKRLPDTLRWY
jgi:hypothetical protein